MGIRQTQFIGLNQQAKALLNDPMKIVGKDYIRRVWFLDNDETREEELEQEIRAPTIKKEEYTFLIGMFEEKLPIYRYTFPDGRIFEEREQTTIQSSGPVIFTALFDMQENKWVQGTRWSRTEIAKY